MKHNIYSIFDTASGLYQQPLFAKSDGEVIRSFSDVANDKEHQIGLHPEDYSLYRLGIFDDNRGTLTDENNECLSTALECVAMARNNVESIDKKQSAGETA